MSTAIRVAPMSDTLARLAGAAATELAVSYAAEQAANARALGFARVAYEVRDDADAAAAALAAMNAADAAWDDARSSTEEAWARLVALVGDDDAPAWVLPDAEPAPFCCFRGTGCEKCGAPLNRRRVADWVLGTWSFPEMDPSR